MKYFALFSSLVLLSGCAKLTHLDELLRLKSLSENQAEQKKYVEKQNENFEALLNVVKGSEANQNQGMEKYPDKESILKAFGEPILTKTVYEDEEVREQLLYRYSEKLSGSEKVYLYFNAKGHLVNWQHFPAGTNKEKTNTQGG